MDAVLPLTLKDYERSLILRRSLSLFFSGLGSLFVVTPDHEYDAIVDRVSQHPEDGLKLEVLRETVVAPELRSFPRIRGWYRQQIIKLAIYEHIQSDFYLTLDADVIATRAVSPAQLVPGGRALCLVHFENVHPDWYQQASAVLGEAFPRPAICHNVTPAVLARAGMAELAAYLDDRWKARRFAGGWRGIRQHLARFRFGQPLSGLAAWRLYLSSGLPWTEYAVYYSFLEATQRFFVYHQEHNTGIADEQHSFWRGNKVDLADWSHEHLFDDVGPPYFAVIQSNTGVTADQVRNKVGDRLKFE